MIMPVMDDRPATTPVVATKLPPTKGRYEIDKQIGYNAASRIVIVVTLVTSDRHGFTVDAVDDMNCPVSFDQDTWRSLDPVRVN